eukprot:10775898-Ditylum_brightwellii.AAC.1
MNLNWKMPGVYDALKQKLNKVWRRNKLVVSNYPERTKTRYQSGGTATLVTSLACHRVCDSGDDKYGRWLYVTLKGKNKRKIIVITAYRVCTNTLATAGENTCWMQQRCALQKKELQPRILGTSS